MGFDWGVWAFELASFVGFLSYRLSIIISS